jgi:hypothetical protein
MSEETKKCPFCAKSKKADSVVCRYCGRDLLSSNDVSASQSVSPIAPQIPRSDLAKHVNLCEACVSQ